MRISILGPGNVGTTLGNGFKAAGHDVAYGSRAPEGAELSFRAAVERAEVVVLTTPWAGVEGTLAAAGDFGGRVLVDVTNPIGPGFTLALGHTTSGAEKVASLAKNARVVKCFNTTGVENMANPRYGEHRSFMPIAGDDKGAVDTVVKLASDLGFDAVGVGPLSSSRYLEPLTLLWISTSRAVGSRDIGLCLLRR